MWQIQKMTDLNKTVKSHVANTEDPWMRKLNPGLEHVQYIL